MGKVSRKQGSVGVQYFTQYSAKIKEKCPLTLQAGISNTRRPELRCEDCQEGNSQTWEIPGKPVIADIWKPTS